MKRMGAAVSLTMIILGACAHPPRAETDGVRVTRADAPSPLVGSWHVVRLELPGADGVLRQITDATGSLIYTTTGQVSVQVMYASAASTPSSGPVQYAQGGYEGSFGQYVVDTVARIVTHRYTGTNVRALLGQDLPRRYVIAMEQLILRSTRADEKWSVTWARD